MQVSSVTPVPAKRARAKPKDETAATAAPGKSRSRKKAVTAGVVEAGPEASAMMAPIAEADMSGRIAITAYFIAAERNFIPGHELDDWLAAERLVRSQHP